MECPACGAKIRDKDAKFCPRCGVGLDAGEFDVTDTIKVDEEGQPASHTSELSIDRPAETPDPTPSDETTDLRARVTRAGWIEAIEGASLAFLLLLCTAALLVLALRLQGIGEGGDIIEIVSVIVLFALGILGVPVSLGRLVVSVVPLGALVVVGGGIVWAVRAALRKRDTASTRERMVVGVKTGACFGLLCFIAALLFRIPGETVVRANPGLALVIGTAWGALFGVLAGWSLPGSLWQRTVSLSRERTEGATRSGILAGLAAAGICALIGVVVVLLWIIGALIAGPPRDLAAGDAFAGLLYLIAFLPNLIVAIVCLGLGSPVTAGAQIGAGGRLIGPLVEYSIFGWGGGDAPWFAVTLLLIPAIACFVAGMYAHKRGPASARTRTILLMALTFAIVLFVLSLFGEARLGPGLLRPRGFAKLSPHPGWTFILAFGWAAVLGHLGWRLSEARGSSE
jgi:Family of unknown function (DUF6350)/zinc-ribbon domain